MKTMKLIIKSSLKILWISLFSLLLIIVGCKSNSSDTGSNTIDSDQKTSEKINVLDLECVETACFIPVDSITARGLVPNEHSIYIEDGKAQIMFLAQDCKTAIWDGKNISPLKKAHVWIRLIGADTITAVPGVDKTWPTFYWWDYKGKTTNKYLKEYTESTAWNVSSVDSIEISLSKYGRIVENTNGKSHILLEWFTNPAESAVPLGINHRVFGRNENGKLNAIISGIIRPVSSGGKSSLKVGSNSFLSIFGTELYGISYDFDMTFQAVFKTKAE